MYVLSSRYALTYAIASLELAFSVAFAVSNSIAWGTTSRLSLISNLGASASAVAEARISAAANIRIGPRYTASAGPRLRERVREDLGRLRARDPDPTGHHEERHAGDPELAREALVGADLVAVALAREDLGRGRGVEPDLAGEGGEHVGQADR